MGRVYLEALKDIKCSECGAEKTCYINKDGTYRWYRNQERGIGFWCKICYNRFWKRSKIMMKDKEEEREEM